MSVADLHAAGKSVDEIAAELGMTRFEVRAELNRVEPPDHGQTFLIPPKGNTLGGVFARDIPNPWFEKRGTKA